MSRQRMGLDRSPSPATNRCLAPRRQVLIRPLSCQPESPRSDELSIRPADWCQSDRRRQTVCSEPDSFFCVAGFDRLQMIVPTANRSTASTRRPDEHSSTRSKRIVKRSHSA